LEKQNNNEAILWLAGGFMAFWFLADFAGSIGYLVSGLIFSLTIGYVVEGKSNVSELTGGGLAIVIISGLMAFMSLVAWLGLV
jgi:hypothetical protein